MDLYQRIIVRLRVALYALVPFFVLGVGCNLWASRLLKAPRPQQPDGVNNVNGYIATGPKAIDAQYKYVATQEVLPRGKFNILITNLVITVHGTSATSQDIWTGVSSLTPESTPQFVEMGHEYATLVKVDGRWYFKMRHVISDAGLPQMFVKTYSSQ